MFGLGFPEIALIGGIALVVLGPKNLPALAASLGTGLREFRKGIQGMQENQPRDPKAHPPGTDSSAES